MFKNMVCRRMLQSMGGNIRQFHVGGAALNEEVEKLLMDIRFPITVGYGLTETGPLVSGNLWQNFKARSGGRLVSGMEAKIVDEEIWVRGENVMLGYYNEPELTKQVLTEDGWFRTGDVGEIGEDGTIYVQGHKSNLIVQADGNKVYPENIEAILNEIDGIDESLVTVWNNQLVALVVTQLELNVNTIREKINAALPSYSRITKIETRTDPFERTPKHSIKRYLYRDNNAS
jgi:long-chain acyl-CoA synthetase